MMEVVNITLDHLLDVMGCKYNAYMRSVMKDDDLARLAQSDYGYTVLKDGNPIACGGVYQHWRGRGEAWIVFKEGHTGSFITLHKMAKRFLDYCPINRIEAAVRKSFFQGHRFVLSLGFRLEAESMPAYGWDGSEHSLYAKVRSS